MGLSAIARRRRLVGRNGSVDWLCWPRFDSAACFSALLGNSNHGRWSIAPREPANELAVLPWRHDDTGDRFCNSGRILCRHRFHADELSRTPRSSALSRDNPVARESGWNSRFVHYGSAVPWVERLPDENGVTAIAGPNLVALRTPVELKGEDLSTSADFTISSGERVPFVLTYGPSHFPPPAAIDADLALDSTETFWREWSARCNYDGHRREAVIRSLLTLKALTFAETGGIVAAPTTSLPEQIGGPRNWDYRYCWVRDATLTLIALMGAGYYEEAIAWRNWLQRAVAGSPHDLQIMYGLSGERRLNEWEVPGLPGYRGSLPVRIGNAASDQLQLDVWGEMMDALHLARKSGLAPSLAGRSLQCILLEHLEAIWERAGRRHLGSAGWKEAFYALEGDGVGCV